MNMLTSLKALLFSSTAAGAGVSAPTPAAGSADFAAMLKGSITQATPAIHLASAPSVEATSAPEGNAVAADGVQAGAAPDRVSDDISPHGLAISVAAGKMPGVPASLPPGLALGLVKRAADPASADEPASSAPAAAVPAEHGSVGEVAMPGGETVPEDALQAAPEEMATQTPKALKAMRLARQADTVVAEAGQPDPPIADAVESASDRQDKPKSKKAEPAPPVAVPPVSVPTIAPPVIAVTVPARPSSSSAPSLVSRLPADVVDQAAAVPSALSKPAAPAVDDKGLAAPPPATATALATAAVAKPVLDKKADGAAARPADPSLTMPVDIGAKAEPVAEDKPLKSEALALLQLARDHASVRQPRPVPIGEELPARAGKHPQGRSMPVEAGAVSAASAITADAPQAMPASSATAPVASAALATPPPVNLSTSLNTQVVDMGVSGQWIDGLARDIAGLSSNGAQGRFQINADQLGPVQVDIRQGSDGAAVHLTVASEAAEIALRQDSDRLKLDAALSAVRIAEVKIDRAAHVSEPARADAPGQQSSQQQSQQSSGQGAAAWANNSQNMGQPQSQQGRWRAAENNGLAAKSSDDPAVLNHVQERQDASDSRRARYA